MPLSGATMTRARRGVQQQQQQQPHSPPNGKKKVPTSSSGDLSSIMMRQLKLSTVVGGPKQTKSIPSTPSRSQSERQNVRQTTKINGTATATVPASASETNKDGFDIGRVLVLPIILLCLLGGQYVTHSVATSTTTSTTATASPTMQLSASTDSVSSSASSTSNSSLNGASSIHRRVSFTDVETSSTDGTKRSSKKAQVHQQSASIGDQKEQVQSKEQQQQQEEEKNRFMEILDHPALIVVDVLLVLFSHGIVGSSATNAIGTFVQNVTPYFKEINEVVRQFMTTGPKQLMENAGKLIKALFKNRSWYSTLGDYTWYLDAETPRQKKQDQQQQKQQDDIQKPSQ